MPVIATATSAGQCQCCSNPQVNFNCLSRSGSVRIAGHPPYDGSSDIQFYRWHRPNNPATMVWEYQSTSVGGGGTCAVGGAFRQDTGSARFNANGSTSGTVGIGQYTYDCNTGGGSGGVGGVFVPSIVYAGYLSEALSATEATYTSTVGSTSRYLPCGELPLCTNGFVWDVLGIPFYPPAGTVMGSEIGFYIEDLWTYERAMAAGYTDGAVYPAIIIGPAQTLGSQCYGIINSRSVLNTDAHWGDWRVELGGTSVDFTLSCYNLKPGASYTVQVLYRRCLVASTDPGGGWTECDADVFTDEYDIVAAGETFEITDHVPLVMDYYTGIIGASIYENDQE